MASASPIIHPEPLTVARDGNSEQKNALLIESGSGVPDAVEVDRSAPSAAFLVERVTIDWDSPLHEVQVVATPTIHPELLMAASLGDDKRLKDLLKAEGFPAQPDIVLEVDPSTPSAALLLEGVTIDGDSALHVLAACGDGDNFLECAKVIHSTAKHLLHASNKNGDTPLHCAARAGSAMMISQLIDLAKGEGHNTDDVKELLRTKNNLEETALHEAVRLGNKDMINMLMAEDSCLAHVPNEGISPLYLAVVLGKADVSKLLYEMSEGVLSYSGADGQNALHAAVLRGRVMTEMVLGWKKDLSKQRDKHGSTPLHFAVSMKSSLYIRICGVQSTCGSEALISKVLEACPSSAYQPDKKGWLPVHVAASTGVRMAIVVLLEKCPGCASLRDLDGRTFLHVAVEKQRNNIVRFACRQKRLSSVLNMQDNKGNTALHLAVQLGNMRVVCSLLGNKQVLLNFTNKDGQTPLDIARSKVLPGKSNGWTREATINRALVCSGAEHGSRRWDQFQEKRVPLKTPEDESKESQILGDSTQTLAIGSVLIATVTFGTTFALPGGYRDDDHPNGGTPTLSGRYTFDAFIMATALAFICSSIATLGLMYSGTSMVSLPLRRRHFNVSVFFLSSSVTSLVAAFALGVYMVLAPVDPMTGIAICVISPSVVLYRNVGRFEKLYALAGPLYNRMGLRTLLSLTKDILTRTLMELWPLILIFSWGCIYKQLSAPMNGARCLYQVFRSRQKIMKWIGVTLVTCRFISITFLQGIISLGGLASILLCS